MTCPVTSKPLHWAVTCLPCGCIVNESVARGTKCPVCSSAKSQVRVNRLVRQLIPVCTPKTFPGVAAVLVSTEVRGLETCFAAINEDSDIRSVVIRLWMDHGPQISIDLRNAKKDGKKWIEYLQQKGFALRDPHVVERSGLVMAYGTHNLQIAFEILAYDNHFPDPDKQQLSEMILTNTFRPFLK
jgi:hypothetical protein